MSTRRIMTARGINSSNGTFDWDDAIFDSLIIAGVTFFSTLGAGTVTGLPTTTSLIAAGIAAATQFFVTLAIKRGLRQPGPIEEETKNGD